MNKYFKLLLLVIACESIGFFGAIFTIPSIPTWYASLNKPFFSPPNFVFGPVWTILYLLMGVSLFLVWENKKTDKNIFYLQLVLNFLWSMVFFGMHSPILGLVVIVLLWWAIFKTIKQFSKINKTAGYLLYPYLAWVSFASLLNLSVFLLN